MKHTLINALTVLVASGLTVVGCSGGSSSGGSGSTTTAAAATSGTPTTPQGWAGAYVGTYQGGGDQGQVLLLAYPNGTLTAWAASSQDPTRRDVLLGSVDALGQVPSQTGLLGTTFQADLGGLSGSYDGQPVQLTRITTAHDTAGAYAGTVINETVGEGGVWSAIVDAQGQVTALMAYPRLGHVSERIDGTLDAAGNVSLGSPLDTGTGRFVDGLAAGRWTARDGSQQGSWQGFQAPRPRVTAPSGVVGAYHGSYRDGAGDQGRVITVIYPDMSFLALAVSEVDASRTDVALGFVAADGSVAGQASFNGTVFSGNLTTGGSYTAGPNAGTFQLARAQGNESIHAGVHFNQTLGVAGVWVASVDGQGRAAGVSAYPTLWFASGVVGTANGARFDATNPQGDTIGGDEQNGFSGGAWSGPSTGQSGWWTGFRLP